MTPTPSTEKGESEVKQEAKEEPGPEATGSDHVEGNQDQGQPEGSQPVQTGIVDLENSTIKVPTELWYKISGDLPMNDVGHLALAKKRLSTLFNTTKKLEILSRRYYGHDRDAYRKKSENMDLPAVPNADPNNEIKDRLSLLAYHRYKSNKHLRSLGSNTQQLCVATLSGRTFTTLPDGRLVSDHNDKILKVWDLNQPDGPQCVAKLEGHSNKVRAVTTLSDGRLASGSFDNTVKVWDLGKPEEQKCVATLKEHTRTVCVFTTLPDGRLVSGSYDGTLKVWALSQGDEQKCVATLRSLYRVTAVTTLPGGRLVSDYDNMTLKVWDLNQSEEQRCVATLSGCTFTTLPNGRLVSSGDNDKTLKVWDLNQPDGPQCVATLKGHRKKVHAVTTLPDGRLVSGSCDKTLKVWDLNEPEGLQCVATLKEHTRTVCVFTTLPDGRLVSGSYDGTLKVWDLNEPDGSQCVATLKHLYRVTAVTILSDGRLASGSDDKTVKVWDLSKGLPAPPSLKRKGSSSFSVDFIQKKIKKDS